MAAFQRSLIGLGVLAGAAPATLAQGVGDLGPNLPPLPQPPALERYLLENPWPAAILLLLVGVALAYGFNRAGRAKPAVWAGLAGIVLSGAVLAVGFAVTTDRERVAGACRQLVDATAEIDTGRLEPLFHPDVRAATRFGSAHGSDPLLEFVRRRMPGAGVTSARVLEVNAALTARDMATTQVRVRVESDIAPPNSWWRVDWIRDGGEGHPADGWRATHIEPLWILGVPNPGG